MFHNFFFCLQISKVDAKIMRNFSVIRQLEHKLGPVSALDYRMILLPLMRSFLQVCTHHHKFCSSALFLHFLLFLYVSALCFCSLLNCRYGMQCRAIWKSWWIRMRERDLMLQGKPSWPNLPWMLRRMQTKGVI